MRRTAAALALACAALLAVSGCGGDDESGGGGDQTETLTVGALPINAVAPLYLGIDKGFFKQERLNIKPKTFQGGAEIVPAVLQGDVQFGFSNTVSLMIAQSKDLPVQVVAEGEVSGAEKADDDTAIVVAKGSRIRSPKDLEGKTIAINTLKNIAEVTVKASLEKKGVDVTKLKFVEVPFPEMVQTLEGGDVDAIFVNEPFTTVAKQAGHRFIARPYTETAPDLPIAPWFTSRQYAADNVEVVERFTRALEKSSQYAADHPEEVRRAVLDYTETPKAIAEQMSLPTFASGLDEAQYEIIAELVEKYGLAKGVDVERLLAQE
jgi:NitT/TauT family transport system substrate-binding protein